MKRLKKKAWFWIHLNRRKPLVAKLARFCKNIHRASEHGTYNVQVNGEMGILATVAPNADAVLFDVGANVGEWTEMALLVSPQARVEVFDMNDALIPSLQAKFQSHRKVFINNLGLGEDNREMTYYSYEGDNSVMSSLVTPLLSHVAHIEKTASIRRGDDLCAEKGIEHVEFLKIDAEAYDYQVIEGFSKMLAQRRVRVIQFEHEGGRYLKDFYTLLAPYGYKIGKLYANYVAFKEHNINDEHLLGPNYIAVHGEDRELLDRLGKGWAFDWSLLP